MPPCPRRAHRAIIVSMLKSGAVWRFVHALCALAVFACTSDDDTSATPGTEGAPCSQSGRCDEGLRCFSNVCIRIESSGGGQTGNTGGEPAGGAPSPDGPCTVGDVLSCSCPDGSNGFLLCDAEVQQFRPCQCGDAAVVDPVDPVGAGGGALDAGAGGAFGGSGGTGGSGGSGGTGGVGVCSPSSAPTECDACVQENCCDAWLGCVDPACAGDGTLRNPGEFRCMSNCSLAIFESVGSVDLSDITMCLDQCAPSGQFAASSTALLECSLLSPSGSSQLGPCAIACFGLETL